MAKPMLWEEKPMFIPALKLPLRIIFYCHYGTSLVSLSLGVLALRGSEDREPVSALLSERRPLRMNEGTYGGWEGADDATCVRAGRASAAAFLVFLFVFFLCPAASSPLLSERYPRRYPRRGF